MVHVSHKNYSRAGATAQGHPLFEAVEPDLARALEAQGTLRVAPSGQVLRVEGDLDSSVLVLLRGSLRASATSADGDELMLGLWRAPAIVGESECVLGIAAQATVTAVEPCVLLELPGTALMAGAASSPRLAMNLLREATAKHVGAERCRRAIAFHPVEIRVADLLLRYMDLYGLPVHEGTKIRIPLGQESLSRDLGVARRSVTRALKAWNDGGVIQKEGQHFVIRDAHALRRVARAGAPSTLRAACDA